MGSDGYVYEGRGWHWVGAHTFGYNSHGFGVAIVGDFSKTLPSKEVLRTVSHVLPSCAVRAGLLRGDYGVLGHRQLVRTTECPGDALFLQLRTWPHFSESKVGPPAGLVGSARRLPHLPGTRGPTLVADIL